MESLKGIFPRSQPPPKRDFLKENVMRIRSMQRMRKPKDNSEYTNKYSRLIQPRKLSLCESSARQQQRSANSLSLCSSKAPINNLRKCVSSMSINSSKDIGVQTVDPESDQFFLKDTIIRYPSASTIRSIGSVQHQQQQTQSQQTCSRGHLMEAEENRTKHKGHHHDRRDDHCDKMERHISNLTEYLDKASISKKPSILKSSSSLQKLNKNSFNESQQKEDRCKSGSARRTKLETVVISDEDSSNNNNDENDEEEHEKEVMTEKRKDATTTKRKDVKGGNADISESKKQQMKAAINDPDCPDGHVPLSEDERLDALKIAQKRFKDVVDELNRLPMTSETLRVRNRKIEIEKELRALEINIRVFSRTKVYVKLNE